LLAVAFSHLSSTMLYHASNPHEILDCKKLNFTAESNQLIISLLELAAHVSAVKSSALLSRDLFSFFGYFFCAAFA
jgi:hypothetical protein